MRESFGALGIYSIVITFIVLFTSYLAVSVNYAKAFRIKNNLVSTIENREGLAENDTTLDKDVRTYLYNQAYNVRFDCTDRAVRNRISSDRWKLVNEVDKDVRGKSLACIFKARDITTDKEIYDGSSNDCPKAYYKVVVFFRMDLPMLGDLLTFNVIGDTRAIYDLHDKPDCVELRTDG